MKKKIKLLTSICTFCLALAVLCFGVFAAIKVTYTVSGTISYEVNDAYVNITTKVFLDSAKYAKASDFSARSQEIETKTLTELSSFVSADGSTLTENTALGSTYNSMTATEQYDPTPIEVKYNSSSTPKVMAVYVVINVENLSDDTDLYIKVTDESNMSIEDTNSFLYRTHDITELSTSTQKNIVLGFALYDATQAIGSTENPIEFNYDVEVGLSKNYSPYKQDTSDNHFYVEMGDYYGRPIRWQLVGTSTTANDVTTVSKFTETTLPTSGEGIFIQETQVFDYTERVEDYTINMSAFNNASEPTSTIPSYLIDDSGNNITATSGDSGNVYAYEYFASKVFKYLTTQEGTYKRIDTTIESKASIFSDYNIDMTTDYIYSKIIARTQADLCKNMGYNWSASSDFTSQVSAGDSKLWLLSWAENSTIFTTYAERKWGDVSIGLLLRSPYIASYDGYHKANIFTADGVTQFTTYDKLYIRPSFKLAF